MQKSTAASLAAEIKERGTYAVFFDIDNTLIPALSDEGVSPRMAQAIHNARKMGHKFFLNSGRSEGYINKKIVNSAEFDGIVSGLGSHVIYGGKTVCSNYIPEDIKRELISYCAAHGESIIFEGVSDESDGRFSLGDSGFFAVPRTVDNAEGMIKLTSGRDIIKITIPYIPCAEYARFLEQYFEMAYVGTKYAEGALDGNNKGKGIFKVCDILGIPRENTVAVGDSENDIRMLEYAAIPVAMGNADDAVKDMCRYICPPVNEDGAAVMVEQLFL